MAKAITLDHLARVVAASKNYTIDMTGELAEGFMQIISLLLGEDMVEDLSELRSVREIAEAIVSAHNSNTSAHADLRTLISTKVGQSDLSNDVDNKLDGAKVAIVKAIIEQLGGMPVFGTVDSNKTITVTSTLEGGTYTLKYTNADGTTSEIGNITIEGTSSGEGTDPGTGTDEKNLVKKATDANTTELYEGCGYKNNTYLSSSNGTPSDKAEYVTTGFIPHDGTSTFYIKGADWVAGDSGCRVMFYNSSYTKYNEGEFYILGSHTSNVTRTVENDYVKVQFNANMTIVKQGAYMRMCLKGTGENLKIYRAQDI